MNIVLADGHFTTRLGLGYALEDHGDMRVVGATGCGEEALRLVEDLRPDLLVLGLNLRSDADGIEVLRRVKTRPAPPRVLVHTVYNFTDDIVSCLLAGADGFVHKSISREGLIDAVRRVASGERVRYLGERVGDPRTRLRVTLTGERLTDRECEIAVLMLRGLSNPEMAHELHVSLPTVRSHVRSVLRKTGAGDRWGFFQGRWGGSEVS